MKKIRLTESQLIDLIKKSVNKIETINESRIINETTYIDSASLTQLAKNLISNMTGDVTSSRLQAAISNLSYVKNMFWEDGTCGIDKLLAYYKGRNGGTEFLTDLSNSYESGDPEFDDLKAKIPNLIVQLRQACVAAKKTESDAAAAAKTAKDTALSSCASKEKNYVDQGEVFLLKPFGKGYAAAYKNGATTNGYSIFYYDSKNVNTMKSVASCVDGELNINKWEKV